MDWYESNGIYIPDAQTAVARFREYTEWRISLDPDWLAPLRGRDLACWCPVDAKWCHADVLLELANREGEQT